jgi:hypothetical protein
MVIFVGANLFLNTVSVSLLNEFAERHHVSVIVPLAQPVRFFLALSVGTSLF